MSGSETDIQWFIAREGKQHGPVSDVELKKLVELSHLKPADLLWRQGFSDWRTASSVFPTIAQPATPAPTPSPAPASNTASSSTFGTAAKPNAPATSSPGPHASGSPDPAPAQPASTYAPYVPPGPGQGSWRPPGSEARPDQGPTRTLGGPAARPGGPVPASAPGPRITTDSRKPSEMAQAPREEAAPRSRARMALVATGFLALAGVGAWLSSQYKDDVLGFLQAQNSGSSESGSTTANVVPAPESNEAAPPSGAAEAAPAAPAAAAAAAPTVDDVDRQLQSRHMWVAVKQQFPDWYQVRVAEAARLSGEHKDPSEISRYLIGELVTLRRENAKHALAASTTRHKELASAFLANLKQLSAESGDGCYDFISKGESSPVIVSRMNDPAKSAEIEAQVVAIVQAIVEGRAQPSEHAAPVKTDYDVLAGELGRLGWTQADMQLFANPKELAKAPRDRVCNMLKDWFTAHLAIQDPSTQERLLFETLKPVISG